MREAKNKVKKHIDKEAEIVRKYFETDFSRINPKYEFYGFYSYKDYTIIFDNLHLNEKNEYILCKHFSIKRKIGKQIDEKDLVFLAKFFIGENFGVNTENRYLFHVYELKFMN